MASVRAQPWTALEADNLTSLAELNENNLLKAIEERYRAGLIYTAVGDILVAVNPFQELLIYDGAWSRAYGTSDVSGLAPHIYRVAAAAYNSMIQGKKNQVCVISGESGAGKTESAKFIMKQVMDMCSSAGLGLKLQQKIIQLNPLLEAFGNARTELNDNSSRFGKFIQLLFESNGRIVGAGLEQYLLEKSRICVQGDKERNFHIFYYLYAGLSPEKKTELHLKSPDKHRYLQAYCHLQTDCTSQDSSEAFSTVLESMQSIGFTSREIEQILILLAAVLHIGDIEFTCSEERGGDSATINNPELVETISQLLCLESSEDLSFALTTLRTVTRGEPVDKLYSCTKAAVVRDATAKAIYARMFQWIISRINTHLQPRDSNYRRSVQEEHLNIGILDIFGFENFKTNSFEQFCINLANEQLQQYFNHQIFAMEKMECAKEGVDDLDISYTDNTPMIDLFLARPIGLLCLLDEQCKGLNGSENAFVQRCRESFSKQQNFKPHRGNALEFTVSHYAGDVTYDIDGFIEKNRDSLPDTVIESLKFSNLHLLGILFISSGSVGGGGRTDQLRKSFLRKSQRSVMRAMSQRRRKLSVSPKKKQRNIHRKLLTVSAHFRESLDLLMERLFAASPHFVRCIKPNLQKQPKLFESDFVLRQLRYTGMLEAVRVRREGYSYRPFFSDFVTSYRAVAYSFTEEDVKLNEATCQVILNKAGMTGWKLARSRVFLRYYHEQRLQLILKEMEDGAILIQRIYRGHRARKIFKPQREKSRLQSLQVSSFLSQLVTHGQIYQPLLKALDRNDILEAPNRFRSRREAVVQPAPAQVGPSSTDYDGLSTVQRNVVKAQKFGFKIGAVGIGKETLHAALHSQKSPQRKPRPISHVKELSPPSEIEVFESSSLPEATSDEASRPPPPKNPPPHSKRAPPPVPLDDITAHSFSSASSLSPSPSHVRYGRNSTSLSPSNDLSPLHSRPPHPTAVKPISPRRKRPPPSPGHSPTPRPRSRPGLNIIANTTTSSDTASNIYDHIKTQYTPIPKPRTKLRNNSADISSSYSSSNDDSQHRRLSESVISNGGDTPIILPRSKRSVSGVKSLPWGETSNETPKNSQKALKSLLSNQQRVEGKNQLTKQSPVHSHLPQGQENMPKKKPLTVSASHNLPPSNYASYGSSEYVAMTTPRPRKALLVESECCESTLDFTSGNSSAVSQRQLSRSVPDLLDETTSNTTSLSSAPTNTIHYPHNSTRAQGLASSTNDLLKDSPNQNQRSSSNGDGGGRVMTDREIRQYTSYVRVPSDDGLASRKSDPPQADKRKNKGWFGRLSRKKSGSNDSMGSSPVRRDSETDVLGLYPGLSYENALEMVSGQPRGTYVLFKDDLQVYKGDSCVYKLAVSCGRDMKMFSILCISGKGQQYQLVNGAPLTHSPHSSLKALINHYMTTELIDGIVLSRPRLIAGVAVTGVSITPRQPQMAQGRHMKRKK